MSTSLALVHHANQYLITTDYDNREGIDAVVTGVRRVLDLHATCKVPINLHLSGTLIEAIAWHDPAFLDYVRDVLRTGLIELVGSCYGQNIMKFFSPAYNRRQLNEELMLFNLHLGVDPLQIKTFWPPERVWDTRSMAPLLRDAKLLNGGYRYVIVDDRLLLAPGSSRQQYDEGGTWDAELFKMHEIEDGLGLVAFPIGTRLRRNIPPRHDEDWQQIRADLESLLVHAQESEATGLLAIYADDLEKVAGIGEWGADGPVHYRAFLEWLVGSKWIRPVRLCDYVSCYEVSPRRKVERGTFQELAVEFDAGEGYERWFLAPDWAPYRGFFNWAESCVKNVRSKGGDPALLELADKQLLVANWETAWHTPSSGPHGDPDQHGHASPWAKALTSHCRHAGVTAEAAEWFGRSDRGCSSALIDIDNDGEPEVLLRSPDFFVVVTPKWGGRITAVYVPGSMVIGNPCDDWNWMEELNRYMDVPRNHPGALADVGFEHEEYIVESCADAVVRLRNAAGIIKQIDASGKSIRVTYELPASVVCLRTECALSPDYLNLLRYGSDSMEAVRQGELRGCRCGGVFVWIRPARGSRVHYEDPYQNECGHASMVRLTGMGRQFSLEIGVTVGPENSYAG